LWVLLAVLFFLASSAAASAIFFVRSVQPPVDAMNNFLREVDRGHYDAAYDRMCRREQGATARRDFPAAIAPFAARLREYNVYSFDPFGRERAVEYWIDDDNGDHTTYGATMVRESGAWRVCDFFK
jgi:hypothetical protein